MCRGGGGNDRAEAERRHQEQMDLQREQMRIQQEQFERNLEAIQFGQQAQSTYEQPPNPALAFASASLNVANTYYSMEFQKQQAGLLTNAEKRALRKSANNKGVPV